ncbi:MAG: formate/nitrite transporter family protein, partial [Bacillota bacterium]
VILGMENSVANMFTIPASLFVVGPTSVVTWKSFLLENLVPVSLGNLVGGAAFVGALYLYLSRRHEQLERAAHTG